MRSNGRFYLVHSLIILISLIALGQSARAVADDHKRQLIVFGDSLSDPGNAFILTGMQSLPPYSLIPEAPYAMGGHRFSNGPTWVERFARLQRTSARPAFRHARGTNYAVGGSRARSVGQVSLTTQVGLYLSQSGSAVPEDALVVIFIGGNDIRDAIEAFASDTSGQTSALIIGEALIAIQDNLTLLVNTGARHFLIANAPDLALVPAVRMQGMQAQQLANFLSASFNQGLAQILSNFEAYHPVSIAKLDIFMLLHDVVADPAKYELDEAEKACITPGVVVGAVCRQPKDYLFWDGIHPTREGHDIIAKQALRLFVTDGQSGKKHKASTRGYEEKTGLTRFLSEPALVRRMW